MLITALSIIFWSVQTLFSITDQRRTADIIFALSGLALALLTAFGVFPIWTHLVLFVILLVANGISATLYLRRRAARIKAWSHVGGPEFVDCSNDVIRRRRTKARSYRR